MAPGTLLCPAASAMTQPHLSVLSPFPGQRHGSHPAPQAVVFEIDELIYIHAGYLFERWYCEEVPPAEGINHSTISLHEQRIGSGWR